MVFAFLSFWEALARCQNQDASRAKQKPYIYSVPSLYITYPQKGHKGGQAPSLPSAVKHCTGGDWCMCSTGKASSCPTCTPQHWKQAVRVEREQGEWVQFCSNGRETTWKRQLSCPENGDTLTSKDWLGRSRLRGRKGMNWGWGTGREQLWRERLKRQSWKKLWMQS